MTDERDGRIARLLETQREDIAAPPSLREDVMRRVHATEAPLWRRALDWAIRPRTFQLSPAGGLAVATVAAVAFYVGGLLAGGATNPVTTSPDMAGPGQEEEARPTRFVLIAPEASSVQLTGDFVDWSPEGIRLSDGQGTGVWTVDVTLEPGVYQYAFIVDGREWRPDPQAISRVDDGFGRENSVVIVSDGVEL